MTWARPPARSKQYTGANPSAPRAVLTTAGGPLTVQASPMVEPVVINSPRFRPILKVSDKSARIRESARGEQCQVRLVGVCCGGTEHTIWSHARWGAQLGDAGRSGARKSLDICGAYACTACDAAYDGQKQVVGMKRHEIDLDWCMAHFRSLAILKQKGLL